ncbi:hypothetical protein EA473_07970 [Natrarchaeobius chitinivorans]|uniref:Uncharacterized protein n=1 Tax=Natrarchaeobius chitinivorans TaxID=1679083 RepID=A0A3N6LXM0_NATCH|nr:hypothetical protein EA473_07970 [Natrarchaeobius chitinivorans]
MGCRCDTVGQNDSTIGRPPAGVSDGDGREFAIDVALTAVRQYEKQVATALPMETVDASVQRARGVTP